MLFLRSSLSALSDHVVQAPDVDEFEVYQVRIETYKDRDIFQIYRHVQSCARIYMILYVFKYY